MIWFFILLGILFFLWLLVSSAYESENIKQAELALQKSNEEVNRLRDYVQSLHLENSRLKSICEPHTLLQTKCEELKDLAVLRDSECKRLLGCKQSAELQLSALNLSLSSACFVRGKSAHYAEMDAALASASRRLWIVSGWVRTEIVTDHFISALRLLISKRVEVCILHGTFQYKRDDESFKNFQSALSRLYSLNGIKIKRIKTHKKILIFDDILIIGSRNWLNLEDSENDDMSIRISSSHLSNTLVAALAATPSVSTSSPWGSNFIRPL